jgi:hypothetical protein
MLRTQPGAGAAPTSGAGATARSERPRIFLQAGNRAVAAGVSRLRAQETKLQARVDAAAPRLAAETAGQGAGLAPRAQARAVQNGLAAAGRRMLAAPAPRAVARPVFLEALPALNVGVPTAASQPAGAAGAQVRQAPPAARPAAVEFELETKADPGPRSAGEVRIDLGQSGGAGLPVFRAHLPVAPGEALTRLLDDEAESVRFTVHNSTGESLCFALPRKDLGEAARTRVYSRATGPQGQHLALGMTTFYCLQPQESIQVTTDPTLEQVCYEVTDADGGARGWIELTQD